MSIHPRENGSVTAELAIAMPAVLLMLTFAVQALQIPADRLNLIAQASQEARAAARGEPIANAKVEGNLVCVTKTKNAFFPITEKQCARRLGL